jgi:hypothetical protein
MVQAQLSSNLLADKSGSLSSSAKSFIKPWIPDAVHVCVWIIATDMARSSHGTLAALQDHLETRMTQVLALSLFNNRMRKLLPAGCSKLIRYSLKCT